MYLTFHCPKCELSTRSGEIPQSSELVCTGCGWTRSLDLDSLKGPHQPGECLRCGNPDLWRQKNFPQSLGFACVAVAAISSSVAIYYYRPLLALAILMFFALIDMVLYTFMPDVLVCYRCRTKHHRADVSQHGAFDHELGERYRQEKIRLEQAQQPTLPKSPSPTESESLPRS